MSDVRADYAALAVACRLAASGEVLENDRQKHLTSAAKWENLALSTKCLDAIREKRFAERTKLADPNSDERELVQLAGAMPA